MRLQEERNIYKWFEKIACSFSEILWRNLSGLLKWLGSLNLLLIDYQTKNCISDGIHLKCIFEFNQNIVQRRVIKCQFNSPTYVRLCNQGQWFSIMVGQDDLKQHKIRQKQLKIKIFL